MSLRNAADRWGGMAMLLHWSIALLVLGLIVVGLWMDDLPTSPTKIRIYALHKSFGLTVLTLMLLRIVWRLADRRPAYPAAMPGWQRGLASAIHGLLYLLLLAMPLSGWLYNSAANFPLRWFGLFSVPALAGADPQLKASALLAHQWGFYLLGGLLLLHIGAALKHHFINRDFTLLGMLPGRRRQD